MINHTDEKRVGMFTESGEMRYFDELIQRYTGKVRAMIFHMVFNDADADDITQEVFVRIVNNIHRFRNESRFSTWLYRITLNTARSYLVKRSRNPVMSTETAPDQPGHSPAPDQILIGGEILTHVTEALAALSPSLRSAITLTAIHGMTVQEAAEVEGCLMATMYWRIHRARKILKKKLTERSSIP